ncbi:MAG: 1,4-alpha-glucan branching protein GlgB [Bacillota bacterium]
MTEKTPSNYDRYLFHRGRHFQAYKFMGAHPGEKNDKTGTYFTVWAPNAKSVAVIGDFNQWQPKANQLSQLSDSELWRTFVPDVAAGEKYKYYIIGPEGRERVKADPYAFQSEPKPKTASVVTDLSNYDWNDNNWIQTQKNKDYLKEPILIYELHLGSWKRDINNNPLNYREIADKLIPYIKKMNYTHIELLPIAEYPFDGSWGYQTTGYYSITSRYGKADDFRYLVDRCHQEDIGVIIDWVPSHFCKDDHGLRRFDGTALFESSNPSRAENKQWDTLNFDFAQPEVWSFLISNAIYWFQEFHIDGIRADAVSNMIYLDYGKEPGEWTPNKYGGRENIEAIEFLRKLNEIVFEEFPSALMIAEESTSWPQITSPAYLGGLGFNLKWNMGWMNDSLSYMEADPIFRKWEHNKLTFSLMYHYSENFILPLSHDEVVHGKKSLLDKMPGDYWQKFANLRLLFTYMIGHPGKKLLFMGGEFGQFIEWNYKQELDWFLLEYEKHQQTQHFVKDLNQLYQNEAPLWQLDYQTKGFEWIEPNDNAQSVLSFIRYDQADNPIIVVLNFTPIPRDAYRIGVPEPGIYQVILNSDRNVYGGSEYNVQESYEAKPIEFHGRPYSLELKLPPLAGLYLKPDQHQTEYFKPEN